jgi:hypothetical protein
VRGGFQHKIEKGKDYELEEVFGGVVWVLGCAFGSACGGWMLADGQWRWYDNALTQGFGGRRPPLPREGEDKLSGG